MVFHLSKLLSFFPVHAIHISSPLIEYVAGNWGVVSKYTTLQKWQVSNSHCVVPENIHTLPPPLTHGRVFFGLHPPHPGNSSFASYTPLRILGFWDPNPHWNFQWPSLGWVWIFLELLHVSTSYNRSSFCPNHCIKALIYMYTCTTLAWSIKTCKHPLLDLLDLLAHETHQSFVVISIIHKHTLFNEMPRHRAFKLARFNGVMSWMTHWKKWPIISSSPLAIHLNLLHPQPSLFLFGIYHLFGVFLP